MFKFLEGLASQPLPRELPPPVNTPPQTAVQRPTELEAPPIVRAQGRQRTDGLLFDLEEEERVVQPGDAVTIHRVGMPDKPKRIKVTEDLSDLEQGFVCHSDEFGEALLGASVGEHVVVRPDGKQPKTYVVHKIERESD